MRWGKIILLFQAVITLIIGVAFFSQLTIIGASEISELRADLISSKGTGNEATNAVQNIKSRFTFAAYFLLIIGLVEVIIIMRLMS